MEISDTSRFQHNAQMLIQFSAAGQPCDITFFNKPPLLNVKVHERLFLAMSYGAGAAKLTQMLSQIDLTNGETVNINDIWVVVPMPKEGISQQQLDAVDLDEAEQVFEGNGKTIREMITDAYHCKTLEEADIYIRRFLAS